jgi:hypothetical protein
MGANLIVILCGGIGHATPFLYDAVRSHPTYHILSEASEGQPESRVSQMIAEKWYGLKVHDVRGNCDSLASIHPISTNSQFLIAIEDRSTNCGGNASESRKVLEACGVFSPRYIIVVQDPTMCRRTVATFNKLYSDLQENGPKVVSWPTFIPQVSVRPFADKAASPEELLGMLEFSYSELDGLSPWGLWSIRRFLDLVMGEIPRLRDDRDGYGPAGRGFIVHVDIPKDIEEAWKTVSGILGAGTRAA